MRIPTGWSGREAPLRRAILEDLRDECVECGGSRETRNRLIREARSARASVEQIARASGLSPRQIRRILALR